LGFLQRRAPYLYVRVLMNEDRYPVAYLVRRLLDVALFFIAVVCLLVAITTGLWADHSDQKLVIGLGMAASAIAVLLEYRQKSVYDNDHVESSLLLDGLQRNYLNAVAKLRHKLVAANILIVVVGMLVSGYGAVWQ
jgi:hypothetical protein